ncbi:MAG: DUF2723 domain-containing protein, partial [Gemmatimonadetes bacterium]|nr:DUF2723 domain-containing protein [Gemmatimonadota bacterium]
SAGAHALWFLVVHHILRYFSEDQRVRLAGALAAVIVSATAFTVWNQSNVNEKVYTVSLFTIALLTWLLFRWQEKLGKGKDDNLLVLMAFILALSVGNHLMAFLAAPAMAVFVLLVHPRALLNWKLYAAGVVVALLGLSVHLLMPLRAALDPVINEAAPRCESVGSALVSIATYGKAGCVALSEALTRQQYDKPPLVPRLAPFHSQVLNYIQYFDWQWARALAPRDVLMAGARLPFTMLFAGLGMWGAAEHARRDRASFFYVLTLFGTLSMGLVLYLNFKYGYSIPDPMNAMGDGDVHEVRERDYFFIASFSVWGLWAGIGIAALWREAAARTGRLWQTAPVLGLALIPLMLNWSWASRAGDYAARDWAHNLLMSVEPYGVLFTNGDNDTFPLWYLQEVEGIRRDVTVIVTSYLNTDWYLKQLRDLTRPCPDGVDPLEDPTRIVCQRPYEPRPGAAGAYTSNPSAVPEGVVPLVLDGPLRSPSQPIVTLDDATIDQVARSYIPMEEARTLRIGQIQATLPANQYLLPWQQFALAILSTSLGERPIHFASSGNAAQSIGVGPYLVRQGLAFKLHNGMDPAADPDVVAMVRSPITAVTGDFVDVTRTRKLAEDVFIHRGGLPEWDHWPDPSTIGIPNYYAWVYYALAQAAAQAGDDEAVERWRDMADRWSILGS